MTRRRWIADLIEADRAFLLGANAAYLSRVLRAQIGQEFDIATPDGVRLGTITRIEADRVTFSLQKTVQTATQNQPTIHLYLAIFKFDRFEWAVEKCTELGVSSIVPVIAQRTDAHLAHAAEKRVERWRRIARGASQQARRDIEPEIAQAAKLQDCLAKAQGNRVVLAETEREQTLPNVIVRGSTLSLAMGPEGGWTESELKLFSQHRWTMASLGRTILRAETAAIAALAVARTFG